LFTLIKQQKGKFVFLTIARLVVCAISLSLVFSPGFGFTQSPDPINLPTPGTFFTVTPSYNPPIVEGITIFPDNPLRFDFIIDVGDDDLQGEALRKETEKLISYFMVTLTVPEDEMWVNLSPHEKNRIIPDGLGQTEMGRDLLAQDYILKQLTASLMYPEGELGDQFWREIHKKAQEKFGTTEIPTSMFNKIWIVPEKAVVHIHESSVFVVNAYLKVMLEEDYLSLEHSSGEKRSEVSSESELTSKLQSDIIREILIPAIEKEVNEGRHFAKLRQVYNSLILATWYKQNLKNTILGRHYVDQNKIQGVEIDDKEFKKRIYDQYLEAFKVGVYDFIKEDYDLVTQETIPRKYFSGGVNLVAPIEVGLPQTDQKVHFGSRIVKVSSAIEIIPGNEGETASSPVKPFKQPRWTQDEINRMPSDALALRGAGVNFNFAYVFGKGKAQRENQRLAKRILKKTKKKDGMRRNRTLGAFYNKAIEHYGPKDWKKDETAVWRETVKMLQVFYFFSFHLSFSFFLKSFSLISDFLVAPFLFQKHKRN